MDPTLMALFGPKSVSGTHEGPSGSWVRKLVVRHTPPEAPAAYTVFPDGSLGSTAMAPIRPTVPFTVPRIGSIVSRPVGPTGVQLPRDVRSGLSVVKIRNPRSVWSATSSPRRAPVCGGWRLSGNFLIVPVLVPLFVIPSRQLPCEPEPMSWSSGWIGLNLRFDVPPT